MCIFILINPLSTRFAFLSFSNRFLFFSEKIYIILSFVFIAVIEFYRLKNNLTRKHPRYFSQSTMFYFMKKLDFPQFAVCTTWMLSSMQSTNKPVLKVSWSPLLGKNMISITIFHEFMCLRFEIIFAVHTACADMQWRFSF